MFLQEVPRLLEINDWVGRLADFHRVWCLCKDEGHGVSEVRRAQEIEDESDFFDGLCSIEALLQVVFSCQLS